MRGSFVKGATNIEPEFDRIPTHQCALTTDHVLWQRARTQDPFTRNAATVERGKHLTHASDIGSKPTAQLQFPCRTPLCQRGRSYKVNSILLQLSTGGSIRGRRLNVQEAPSTSLESDGASCSLIWAQHMRFVLRPSCSKLSQASVGPIDEAGKWRDMLGAISSPTRLRPSTADATMLTDTTHGAHGARAERDPALEQRLSSTIAIQIEEGPNQ